MHDPDGDEPVVDSPFDRALRAGFRRTGETGDSVLARLRSMHGVRSSVLLHDAPNEDSPLLKVHSLDRSETVEDDSRYQIAGEIASRRPAGVQGTVRAIWESLDMMRTMALQNGLAYTHIGNDLVKDDHQLQPRLRKPEIR